MNKLLGMAVGVGLVLGVGCRSGRPSATEQAESFRRMFGLGRVGSRDTICVALVRNDRQSDPSSRALTSLRTGFPNVLPASACGSAEVASHPRVWFSLDQATIKGDTLSFTGWGSHVIYRCRASISGRGGSLCSVGRAS